MGQYEIGNADERGQDQHGREYHRRRTHDLLARGPGDFLHLGAHFWEKFPYIVEHAFPTLFLILFSMLYTPLTLFQISGAAGIEPAVPVLETGGLPLTDAPNTATSRPSKKRISQYI